MGVCAGLGSTYCLDHSEVIKNLSINYDLFMNIFDEFLNDIQYSGELYRNLSMKILLKIRVLHSISPINSFQLGDDFFYLCQILGFSYKRSLLGAAPYLP